MSIPAEHAKEIAAFPEVLRTLIEAELAAGNTVAELSHGFPAAPVGAYVVLAKPVTSRARESGGGISFYDRNCSNYSGEFTTENRHFFVLEPPHPPEPEPDMDAIRAEIQARQAAEDAKRGLAGLAERAPASAATSRRKRKTAATAQPPPRTPDSAVTRFEQSMVMDYEKWREGTGYDLSILKSATPEELVAIENLLVQRGTRDWRDVEALAALNSPRAKVALRAALKSSDSRVRTAVADYAPWLVSDKERSKALIQALAGADTYGGLTQALLQIEEYHPPEVIDALLKQVLAREDDAPVHFAAMLMFLHGKADCAFDWSQRPFFLKFKTTDRAERVALFLELCEKIGVKPGKYLRAKRR